MSSQPASPVPAIAFGKVTPVLRVSDVEASETYYVEKLGFHVDFRTMGFVSVTRGRTCLFLCEGDQGHFGAWVWIDGVKVEEVYEEFVAAGAKVRHPPTNYFWALEMQVEDLDGNILRIGSDPKQGEPMGEWLDMNGVRWAPQPSGGWKRVEQP